MVEEPNLGSCPLPGDIAPSRAGADAPRASLWLPGLWRSRPGRRRSRGKRSPSQGREVAWEAGCSCRTELPVEVRLLRPHGLQRPVEHVGLEIPRWAPAPAWPPTPNASLLASAEKHFVDLHQVELIECVVKVKGVLDLLLGDVLDFEQYQRILAEKTSHSRMRELFKLMLSWTRQCKDRLYEALKKQHPHLIEDLEK
uniref:CARD domain-containing protein n=1 Tax=Dromaius novaehollandiae TaxID=8790 RepID=A0A8C4JRJ0_DRONO